MNKLYVQEVLPIFYPGLAELKRQDFMDTHWYVHNGLISAVYRQFVLYIAYMILIVFSILKSISFSDFSMVSW